MVRCRHSTIYDRFVVPNVHGPVIFIPNNVVAVKQQGESKVSYSGEHQNRLQSSILF